MTDDNQLDQMPTAEDDRHEYKSSLTKDAELSDKIAKAASGFWNSGGGLFVIGIDGVVELMVVLLKRLVASQGATGLIRQYHVSPR